MSGNAARLQAIKDVEAYAPPAVSFISAETPGEIFGGCVFSKAVMQKRLPKSVFKSVIATIEHGAKLDPVVADAVASAMKDWALEKGATHYAHVFYPLTGLTAEKHDSFLEPLSDGSALAEFAGKTLIQGEPDASSFPNGGLRNTFEARGYTGWDVTSPAYVLENPNGNTLCIPTVFVSMTGEALDHKTPLLRSQQAMGIPGRAHLGAVRAREPRPRRVVLRSGAGVLPGRPALLPGPAGPAQLRAYAVRGQAAQGPGVRRPLLRRHPRARAGLHDGQRAGAVQAGHPGQDPAQRGRARPVRDRADVRARERGVGPPAAADDHAQDRRQEARHGDPVPREAVRRGQRLRQARQLLAGQRGSGQPARARRHPARERAVPRVLRRRHPRGAQVLRAAPGVGRVRNQRPPPRRQRGPGRHHLDLPRRPARRRVRAAREGPATSSKGKGKMVIGVDTLPVLPTDPGDRNRTSPFAFTGNRFEFRAPGSMQTVAAPMVTINTIMAEALDYCATALETAVAGGTEFDPAVQDLLREIITTHGAVVFNGDGYSEKWQLEAAERGLPNLRTSLDAFPELITDSAMELFEKYKVFNHREMHSRYEIGLEQYGLTIGVEARLTLEMGSTLVLPAAVRHQTELAVNVGALKAAGIEADAGPLTELTASVTELRAALAALKAELEADAGETALAEAEHAGEKLLPAMAAVRAAADVLEGVVADDLWPLPTYQEMLYIL